MMSPRVRGAVRSPRIRLLPRRWPPRKCVPLGQMQQAFSRERHGNSCRLKWRTFRAPLMQRRPPREMLPSGGPGGAAGATTEPGPPSVRGGQPRAASRRTLRLRKLRVAVLRGSLLSLRHHFLGRVPPTVACCLLDPRISGRQPADHPDPARAGPAQLGFQGHPGGGRFALPRGSDWRMCSQVTSVHMAPGTGLRELSVVLTLTARPH